MKIAFYKGNGSFMDRLIKWWTKGKYSHTEVIFEHNVSFSITGRSPYCGRFTIIDYKPENWDIVDVLVFDEKLGLLKAKELEAKPYDWIGILFSQIFPFKLHLRDSYFCSEASLEILKYADPFNTNWDKYESNLVSPNLLYKIIKGEI